MLFGLWPVFFNVSELATTASVFKSTTVIDPSLMRVAGLYVLTLVPIASDPFGVGWDLFGTKNHFIRIGLVDARAVWYIAIGAIVTGHIVAVYLALCIALKTNADRQAALRSQWPMVALMDCYTVTSLWIIAQPIVTTR